VQLTKGSGEEAPSFSPDSKWVVYTALNHGKPIVLKVPVEGGEPVPLTEQPAQRPLVSPDGKYIACVYDGKVAIIPFDGGKPIQTFDKIPLVYPQIIRWMPDSRALCYLNVQGGVTNIWSQPIDGTTPRQVTNFKEDLIFRYAWSQDGGTLACERGTQISDIIMVSDFK
jgi:Tol biopolymer transport system component